MPPPVEPRNRMLGPSQHYIFLVQNCIARENVIFFNTKFIFLVHNYIPSTNFIFVVETLYLLLQIFTFLFSANFLAQCLHSFITRTLLRRQMFRFYAFLDASLTLIGVINDVSDPKVSRAQEPNCPLTLSIASLREIALKASQESELL